MKAILCNKDGFTRDYSVSPPPPPTIRMAQIDSAVQIYDPHDLMDAEKMVAKEIRFNYSGRVKNPNDTEDILLYIEEGATSKIIAADSNFFFRKMSDKYKASMSSAKEMVEKLNELSAMNEEKAISIAKEHKELRKYGQATEELMAKIGYSTPPGDMHPMEYLDKLLTLATQKQIEQQTANIQTLGMQNKDMQNKNMQNKIYNPYDPYGSGNSAYGKLEQNAYKPYDPYGYGNSPYGKWEQNAVNSNWTYSTNWIPGNVLQSASGAGAMDTIVVVPPMVEKAVEKKEVPEPIEPKKRLMKKI